MLFNLILKNKLIFNSCWEDPRIDRKLFQLNENSKILTITSAGCNALEYLLDNPAEVNCCDINPAQNAVMELKIALFEHGDYELLWKFFGLGKFDGAKAIYRSKLRKLLSESSTIYWDKKISYFKRKNGFYRSGVAGKGATVITTYLKANKKLNSLVELLFQSDNLESQLQIYKKVEKKLWNKKIKFMLDNYFLHYLWGVPKSQYKAGMENESSFYEYIKINLLKVFGSYPAIENHYWKVYFNGNYDLIARPKYLDEKNFDLIRKRVKNIKLHNTYLEEVLKKTEVTHLNLLDHQDWHIGKSKYIENFWDTINTKKELQNVLMRTSSPNFPLPLVTKNNFAIKRGNDIEVGRVGTYYETIFARKIAKI